MTTKTQSPLNFEPKTLKRELKRHYISASEDEVETMLKEVEEQTFEDLYRHFPSNIRFKEALNIPEELTYEELQSHLEDISEKNKLRTSFLGDALQQYKVHEIVPFVSGIRNLTTAYTPYQPEYSQGTLITLWIYQCMISALTGFEAVNASLYDRSTALFEALSCASRLTRGKKTVLLSEGLYPQDIEVVKTLACDTALELVFIPLDEKTGTTSVTATREALIKHGEQIAGFAFPQVNQLGLLEEVDALTNLAHEYKVKSIAVIDPMLLASGGLKPPCEFGEKGTDIMIGEGQHLAIGPNFGGPGLGIFGVRYNTETKNDIRSTPGRYIGRAKDQEGKDVLAMVLSTREQHIRKEKATSNICSNQSFLATLAGASILARGEEGMTKACMAGNERARHFAQRITASCNVELSFPDTAFFNEVVVTLPENAENFVNKGLEENLLLGVDMTGRVPRGKNAVKVSFSDFQTNEDLERLVQFFQIQLGNSQEKTVNIVNIPTHLRRTKDIGLPKYSVQELKDYYTKLGELNLCVDDAPYPLGSCTMKYNPYINDWAAGLEGFTNIHPQAPIEDTQGCLEIYYEIQEWFKGITGLAGATTQPVAGAQGELVGLKLFQAYFRHKGEARDIILIPKSSHGTNFATAVMAGYEPDGIIQLEADEHGLVDLESFNEKILKYGSRISGMMMTNPNTGGLFETNFKKMAEKIHNLGGLVYMDGANMNAIAGWVNLKELGVDAVHQNLHKTWTIPHGGGGPGDGLVAVSDKLVKFLPGFQVVKIGQKFSIQKPKHSIGTFHRHWGNFAHKVRCYSYLCRLGQKGVPRMSAMAVLSARYMYKKLSAHFPTLPLGAEKSPRMHEFILTLNEKEFKGLEAAGIPKNIAIPRVGKLFLDFGYHAPTVAFPEVYGLMIEPTESFTKVELDRLIESILYIKRIINEKPELLKTAPHYAPIKRTDEVEANRNPVFTQIPFSLFPTYTAKKSAKELLKLTPATIFEKLISTSLESF